MVCLERAFDSPESLQENGDIDAWWREEVLPMVKDRTYHIHARVGFGEGP